MWHPICSRQQAGSRRTRGSHRRRGSTLLMVVGLLGLLVFMGFVFYSFSAQERNNADYGAESVKQKTDPRLSPELLWDFALEQIIVGPDVNLRHSPLWGGRHSLVRNLVGWDTHPYSGSGINLKLSAANIPQVDQDQDGTPDNPTFLYINDSFAASGGLQRSDWSSLPSPDVDYTYPDINNVFLAYNGYGIDNSPSNYPVKVIIPSYHRPQYLRGTGGNPTLSRWYDDVATTQQVMRPHPNHVNVGTGGRRFVLNAADATALAAAGLKITGPFPFAPSDDPAGDSSVQGEQGPWTILPPAPAPPPYTASRVYEWDADADGDGVREAVYLDLDYPLQTRGDGRRCIPLFAITIYDADGLMNLNAHGNVTGRGAMTKALDFNNGPSPFFGNAGPVIPPDPNNPPQFISASNLGLSPWEVNPQWVLNAEPRATLPLPAVPNFDFPGDTVQLQAALYQHQKFFNHMPTTNAVIPNPGSGIPDAPVPWLELSNMEWWFLTMGRPEYVVQSGPGRSLADVVSGRWSGINDRNTLWTRYSMPGQPAYNTFPFAGRTGIDDNGNRLDGETANLPTPFIAGISRTPFQKPLDYQGSGYNYTIGALRYSKRVLLDNTMIPPLQLPGYQYYSSATSTVTWANIAGGNYMPNLQNSPLQDEPEELVVDRAQVDVNNDSAFPAAEMAALHLSEVDRAAAGVTSRVLSLAPFNLQASQRAPQIRERLTTESWDRKQYARPLPSSGSPSASRRWEYNPDSPGGTLKFPPKFGSISRSTVGASPDDPFRRALRTLLEIDQTSTVFPSASTSIKKQFRYPLNQMVEFMGGNFRQRPLTPHPQNLPANPVVRTMNGTTVDVSASMTPREQEARARADRQQMARDIYVMLYTFCGGNDAIDYANTANSVVDAMAKTRVLYDDAQCREMAQFAVNVVDALDPDDTITLFEYDMDLSDGWNLDDNSYDNGAGDTASSADRGLVYGVETQQLSISEVLGVYCPQLAMNHPATTYDDSVSDRRYIFIELQSTLPNNVVFTNEQWQIHVRQMPGMGAPVDTYLTLREVAPGVPSVPAGGRLTIGSRTGSDTVGMGMMNERSSNFRVDYNMDGTFENIAPPGPSTATAMMEPMTPTCDVDLVHNSHANRFYLTSSPTPPYMPALAAGSLVLVAGANDQIRVELRRRADLTREKATNLNEDRDNPWIVVDRFTSSNVAMKNFGLNAADVTQPMIQAKLVDLVSVERSEPFNRANGEAQHAGAVIANSLKQLNSNAPAGGFTFWQPHFDRDFSSPIELFNIPLYGPREVTLQVGHGTATALFGRETAGREKFLQPDYFDPTLAPGNSINSDPKLDNRWYRLLEFVEVPTRTHTALANSPLGIFRVPGKINFNTIRHPDVLAGLIDDNIVLQMNPPAASFQPIGFFGLTSRDPIDGGRDWWIQLLKARDQLDTVTGMYLPGLPGSKPFRSLAYSDQGLRSINSTLLRGLPLDNGGESDANANGALDAGEDTNGNSRLDTPRHLLEVGNYNEHANYQVDFTLRNRLLSKVWNNTTNRSHVFYAFIQVDFFEADVDAAGNVKIGAKMTDVPSHRGFFVIDRSQPERAYNTVSQRYDYRPFVVHRQTLK